MALEIKLEAFEGPLDLLLHLIEKNKVDIYDIPIVEITEQYMEYIHAMERTDMNLMSEFMLMAATLMDIKCKMLLPREVNEEGQEEDPREELVQKLLEYKMYKYMSYELKDRHLSAAKSLYHHKQLPEEVKAYQPPVDYEALFEDVTLAKLNEILQAVLKRTEDRVDPVRSNFGRIQKDEINMEEKTEHIVSFIRSHKKFSFRHLLETKASRMEVIVTFLVLLELMKTGCVSVSQESIDDDIEIVSNESEEDADGAQ